MIPLTRTSLLSLCTIVLLAGCATTGSEPPAKGPAAAPPPSAPSPPTGADGPRPAWPQWGGPQGDFEVENAGLATSWPDDGPGRVWSRSLGAGYSAVAATDSMLFTMYRDGEEDVVVALSAADGSTAWEHRYRAPTSEKNMTQFGEGPNASPLVIGGRLVTLGYTGLLHGLDAATGEVIWSHDLVGDLGGEVLQFGFSASPIEYDGNVIVLVGGERQGALALSPDDGSIVWRGTPGSVSYATPIVIDVGGQEQLVYLSADEVIGLDAASGEFVWSFPVANQYRNNCTAPQWGDDGLLWVATQLDGGTRALRLTRDGDTTRVEEVWTSNKMSVHYWNTMRLGDHVYASIGSNASILAGIDVGTGTIAWRQRGFEKVNFVQAGDFSILLDAEGRLALAKLSPEGVGILSETQLEGPTWTVPTLVGTRLYVRNLESIFALELGPSGTSAS